MLFFGWALAAVAQDAVSDAVDKALWCGGAYIALTQMQPMSADEIALADANATQAVAAAVLAMNADGIAESDHERMIDAYVEIAFNDLTQPEATLRYSDAECGTFGQ